MPLTAAARAELYAEESSDVLITLVKVDLTPASLGYLRFCTDTQDITVDHGAGNETYLGSVIQVTPPEERDRGGVRATVVIPGAPDSFVRDLKDITFEPEAEIKIILLSDKDNPMAEYSGLTFSEFGGDPLSIEFVFRYEELARMPYPYERFVFSRYPGGFT